MKKIIVCLLLLSLSALAKIDTEEQIAMDDSMLVGGIRDCEEMNVSNEGKLTNTQIPPTILKCMAPVELEEEALNEKIISNSEKL